MNRTVVLMLLCMGMAACHENPSAPPDGLGSIEGDWHGGRWVGRGFAVLSNDTLYIVGRRNVVRVSHEEIQVRLKFAGAGTYEVYPGQGSMARSGAQASVVVYPAAGVLQVRNVNGNSMITGSLELSASGGSNEWRFLNGDFSIPVFASFAAVPGMVRH